MSVAKIVHRKDMRGGSPTIDKTRITVTDMVWNYRFALAEMLADGASPPDLAEGRIQLPLGPVIEKILDGFPSLTREDVEAALAYWRDHPEEIQRELEEEHAIAEKLKKKYSVPR